MCKEKARKYLNKHYVDNTFSLNEEVKNQSKDNRKSNRYSNQRSKERSV